MRFSANIAPHSVFYRHRNGGMFFNTPVNVNQAIINRGKGLSNTLTIGVWSITRLWCNPALSVWQTKGAAIMAG
ncbi:MAG: hypothetical protein ACI8PP_000548 [Candidatus Pseudothioglobus sp.]|jgi:hypothetical protein